MGSSEAGTEPSPESISLLHLSDLQFGLHHRFTDPDDADASLFSRLNEDLQTLASELPAPPQMIIVSGDLAEMGRRTEFEQARGFLKRLSGSLRIPTRRVVLVPGNHDINRDLSAAYFAECAGDERQPLEPFPRKWDPFRRMFDDFYANDADITFTAEEPWTFWEIPELRLVVAGLNSTMRESHRTEDHYGWAGTQQLRHFTDRLASIRQ